MSTGSMHAHQDHRTAVLDFTLELFQHVQHSATQPSMHSMHSDQADLIEHPVSVPYPLLPPARVFHRPVCRYELPLHPLPLDPLALVVRPVCMRPPPLACTEMIK